MGRYSRTTWCTPTRSWGKAIRFGKHDPVHGGRGHSRKDVKCRGEYPYPEGRLINQVILLYVVAEAGVWGIPNTRGIEPFWNTSWMLRKGKVAEGSHQVKLNPCRFLCFIISRDDASCELYTMTSQLLTYLDWISHVVAWSPRLFAECSGLIR